MSIYGIHARGVNMKPPDNNPDPFMTALTVNGNISFCACYRFVPPKVSQLDGWSPSNKKD